MTVAPVLGPIGPLIEHALNYAANGREIFPVNPRDKTPLVSQYKATVDPDVLRGWWERWPGALLGHRIPPHELVTDIDKRSGGHNTWRALLVAANVKLPLATRAHYSGRDDGGGHIWWLMPGDRVTIARLDTWAEERGLGKEIAGDDGRRLRWTCGIDLLHRHHRYTILPPSPHPETGKPYHWPDGRDIYTPALPLPQLLADLIVDDEPPPPPRPPTVTDPESIADWYSDTARWADLLHRHGWTLVAGDGDSDGARWRHPTATSKYSATIRHGCLFVYSGNTPFEPTSPSRPHGYTRFAGYALLEHSGDRAGAARAARVLKDGEGARYHSDLSDVIHPDDKRDDEEDDQEDDGEAEEVFIDWSRFWQQDHKDAEWVYEPILAHGRGHAVYAPRKVGKSLLLLWMAAQLATRPGHLVMYLDFEMTEADVYERLADMGYGPDSDLTKLRYAVLPSLPPLDSAAGAKALLALVDREIADNPDDHVVVIIDTTSRVVAGPENDADTFRAFYQHTGRALKKRKVTYARADHAGKDPEKGQRGSSAKGDDVDVVWRVVATDDGFCFNREAARMSWVPERVPLRRSDEPLAFSQVLGAWPAGTKETAVLLDQLDLPLDAGYRQVGEVLKAQGKGVRAVVIRAAQKYRRQQLEEGLL